MMKKQRGEGGDQNQDDERGYFWTLVVRRKVTPVKKVKKDVKNPKRR
jgi:hypothetical protein